MDEVDDPDFSENWLPLGVVGQYEIDSSRQGTIFLGDGLESLSAHNYWVAQGEFLEMGHIAWQMMPRELSPKADNSV